MIDKTHSFDKTIIRAYDIRGIYNKTLFDLDAKIIGNLFGLKIGVNKKSIKWYIVLHIRDWIIMY